MNIVLTGMPACGKSTVGVVLAKTAGMSFLDTDLLIQERVGMKLQDILNEKGMDEFLRLEEEVLASVDVENTVISTGGSAVYSDRAMKHLDSIGTVVYLQLSLEEIRQRLNNIKTRGIAMGPGETLADLYDKRVPLYEKYANVTITAAGLTVEECIEAILERV
ncbi:MAG: shikimate kinase [Clostridia bacterium]|nr:shikimate kinase [Clostridia bacterium]